MSYTRPTVPELLDRTTADLVARLSIFGQPLNHAVVRKIARVWSNAVNGLHGHISWGVRQYFIKDADDDNLARHGVELSIPQLNAQYATGPVALAGTTGTAVAAGQLLKRSDGVQYRVNADATVGGDFAIVTAVDPGAAGNAVAGVSLTLVTPISGVSSSAVVAGDGIAGGTDVETPDHYRNRMLARKRNIPQGGAAVDYDAWAKAASAAVTRVFVRPQWMGPGTVGVLFVCDGQPDIIPTDLQVSTVQTYIDQLDIRPVTADVYAVAPAALAINHTIQLTPNTEAVQQAVLAELQDFYVREAQPGLVIALSNIDEAISLAEGEQSHVLVSPSAPIEPAPNQIPVLGAVVFS